MKIQVRTDRRAEQIIHYKMKNWIQVIKRQTPYKIEKLVLQG